MISIEEINEFLEAEFPQNEVEVLAVGKGTSTVRLKVGFDHIRPGNTVSGPALMGVADCGAYIAIIGEIGLVAQAVTTNLNINFMRRPVADKNIIGKCRLLKSGKRLMVCEVTLYSEGMDEPVAHSTATYALPY